MNYPLFLTFEQYTPGKSTIEKETVHDTIYRNLDSPHEHNKIQLTLKQLPVKNNGYRLGLTITDANYISFIAKKPVVLSDVGMININLHETSRTFYIQRKNPTSLPEEQKYAPYDDETYFNDCS